MKNKFLILIFLFACKKQVIKGPVTEQPTPIPTPTPTVIITPTVITEIDTFKRVSKLIELKFHTDSKGKIDLYLFTKDTSSTSWIQEKKPFLQNDTGYTYSISTLKRFVKVQFNSYLYTTGTMLQKTNFKMYVDKKKIIDTLETAQTKTLDLYQK